MNKLSFLPIARLRDLLVKREIQPSDILDDLVGSIHLFDGLLKCFVGFDLEEARRRLDECSLDLALGGIPIAFKDIMNAKGQPCTCGSRIQDGYVAPFDSTPIYNLRKAGAIPFGRTNLDEFAMGSSTENSCHFTTINPWDLTRVAGGSSGGSAAAVAAGLAVGALGTDTGGSIRQPAAFCGVVGLKPSYGRVSRFGVAAYASSLDQVGCITRTTEDAALILSAIAGHDPSDSTSRSIPVPDYLADLSRGLKGLRVGIPKQYFSDAIEPQTRQLVEKAIGRMGELGATIVELSLPNTDAAIAAYYIIATAEASANLARYDGIRYGRRGSANQTVNDVYTSTRTEGFGAEVKRRILLGTFVLSAGYYDAYYKKAQKVRSLIRSDFESAFSKVDVLACPTSPFPAFKVGQKVDDPLQMYLADICTIAVNLAGVCAISVPCGFAKDESSNLPIGLQLMADAFNESVLLRAAHAYEQSSDWHKMRPILK